MNKDQCFYLGSVAKLHGYKGELSLFLDVDYPEQYAKMESVFVDLNNQLVPFFIERIKYAGKQFIHVKFEGISTESQAKELLKKELYLPLTLLPKLADHQFYYHEVIGFKVVDKRLGEIGQVTEIIEHPTNPLIVIQKDQQESIVPLNDQFIKQVDKKEQCIFVNTPEGLIEVNW